ncbi:MAG TPA: hypothetical protein PKW80_16395 [Bacteroidales bacterium]|nr:hypothetical protein [Bacteroidales bacterium]
MKQTIFRNLLLYNYFFCAVRHNILVAIMMMCVYTVPYGTEHPDTTICYPYQIPAGICRKNDKIIVISDIRNNYFFFRWSFSAISSMNLFVPSGTI